MIENATGTRKPVARAIARPCYPTGNLDSEISAVYGDGLAGHEACHV
jgi:hypothetical protein